MLRKGRESISCVNIGKTQDRMLRESNPWSTEGADRSDDSNFSTTVLYRVRLRLLFRPQEGIESAITVGPCSTERRQTHFSRPVLTKQSTAFLDQAFIVWWRRYVYHFPSFVPNYSSTGRSFLAAGASTRWLKRHPSTGKYTCHTTPFGGRPSHVSGMDVLANFECSNSGSGTV
jgi:hypothetical protein